MEVSPYFCFLILTYFLFCLASEEDKGKDGEPKVEGERENTKPQVEIFSFETDLNNLKKINNHKEIRYTHRKSRLWDEPYVAAQRTMVCFHPVKEGEKHLVRVSWLGDLVLEAFVNTCDSQLTDVIYIQDETYEYTDDDVITFETIDLCVKQKDGASTLVSVAREDKEIKSIDQSEDAAGKCNGDTEYPWQLKKEWPETMPTVLSFDTDVNDLKQRNNPNAIKNAYKMRRLWWGTYLSGDRKMVCFNPVSEGEKHLVRVTWLGDLVLEAIVTSCDSELADVIHVQDEDEEGTNTVDLCVKQEDGAFALVTLTKEEDKEIKSVIQSEDAAEKCYGETDYDWVLINEWLEKMPTVLSFDTDLNNLKRRNDPYALKYTHWIRRIWWDLTSTRSLACYNPRKEGEKHLVHISWLGDLCLEAVVDSCDRQLVNVMYVQDVTYDETTDIDTVTLCVKQQDGAFTLVTLTREDRNQIKSINRSEDTADKCNGETEYPWNLIDDVGRETDVMPTGMNRYK